MMSFRGTSFCTGLNSARRGAVPTTAVQCSSLGDVWITIAAIPTGMIVFEMLSGKVFQSTFLVVNKLVTSWIAVFTTTDMVAMWVNGHSGNDFPYGLLVTSTITTNTTSANTVKVATVAETNLARAICCPRIILPKRYLLRVVGIGSLGMVWFSFVCFHLQVKSDVHESTSIQPDKTSPYPGKSSNISVRKNRRRVG